MKILSKMILTLSFATLLAVAPVAHAFILPPAPIPILVPDPSRAPAEVAQVIRTTNEIATSLTKAYEATQQGLLALGSFGSSLVNNVVSSLVSPKTSQTVKQSMATTDDSGTTHTPDNLKNQGATKQSAQKALTMKDDQDTEMADVSSVRGKIPSSKRDFSALSLATAWNLGVEAATEAFSHPDSAYAQITGEDARSPDLRSQITINNNVNMRFTSAWNRSYALFAIRAGLAGYRGLEKSGTLQNAIANISGANLLSGASGSSLLGF